jgi:hypothetical protein
MKTATREEAAVAAARRVTTTAGEAEDKGGGGGKGVIARKGELPERVKQMMSGCSNDQQRRRCHK